MYTYTQKDVENFYMMYKEYYETHYKFNEYKQLITKLKSKHENLYNSIIIELDEQDDNVVKDKREIKNKAKYFFNKEGKKIVLDKNKKQVVRKL